MALTSYKTIHNVRYTEHLNVYADERALHLEFMAVDLVHRDVETDQLHYMELEHFQAYLLWQLLTEWVVKYWLTQYNMSREITGPSIR